MAKKFISFLGKGNYQPCVYALKGKNSEEVQFIQEALLKEALINSIEN